MLGAVTLTEHDFGAAENGTPAERIVGEEFSPELLQALGVQPLLGRLFTPDEDEIDHPAPGDGDQLPSVAAPFRWRPGHFESNACSWMASRPTSSA